MLELAPGGSAPRSTGEREEVLFVLSGRGGLRLGGAEHALEPESGAYLAPGETYELRNPGDEPLRLVAVSIPDPAPPDAATGERAVVRRLADQAAQAATTQREFRIVADPASGLRSATHFVGYIPTARAPDHMHYYDEVIYVLDGEGAMHMNGETTPLRARVLHPPPRAHGALPRERRLGRHEGRGGVPPGGLARRRVLPRRHACYASAPSE